jgi:endoribonuclease Dicer
MIAQVSPTRLDSYVLIKIQVDSVQLIFQQYAVLDCNLDQPMVSFCGAMGSDLLDRRLWEKACEDNMVIVCTADVLRNSLHHSFISIDRVNLLIFDEAHHAKKDHPYARIIKDFYAQEKDKSKRPKIFGMTASPVDTRLNIARAAQELEAILHCRIATASDLTLLQYAVNSKEEIIDIYEPLRFPFETPLYKKIREKLEDNEIFSKLLRYAKEASSELGTWCADHLWLVSLTEEEMRRLEAKTERKFITQKGVKQIDAFETQITELQDARKIVDAHSFEDPQPSLDHLSTKVMNLVLYLKERFERPTDDKCIVFVKQRYTARILSELFSHPNFGSPNLRVGTLVCSPPYAEPSQIICFSLIYQLQLTAFKNSIQLTF